MPKGHIVLVTTAPLEGGGPLTTAYFVAEQDAATAEALIARDMAPNETVGAVASLEEAAIAAMALKPGEFRKAQAPNRTQDNNLDEALAETFPASDPVSIESTLVTGAPTRG